MGSDGAPSRAARITARAIFGCLIIAAPAPCFSIVRSGHPMLISMPSKPSFSQSAAASRILSGCDEKSCATIGRSARENSRSRSKTFRPTEQRPSAETNSVQNTSGLPDEAMSRRKAASVTSAIGARTKNGSPRVLLGEAGFLRCAQNPLCIGLTLYHRHLGSVTISPCAYTSPLTPHRDAGTRASR